MVEFRIQNLQLYDPKYNIYISNCLKLRRNKVWMYTKKTLFSYETHAICTLSLALWIDVLFSLIFF